MNSRPSFSFLTVFVLFLSSIVSIAGGSRPASPPLAGKERILEQLLGTRLDKFRRPAHLSSPAVILVTNTSDAGPGSFRQAIIEANNHIGADSIAFNIPKTDPGYDNLKGVWTIKPLAQYPPLIEDGTIIEGHSQKLFSPGSNPAGPAVELDGSRMTPIDICLLISCSWTVVHELAINRFETGIVIAGPGHSFNLVYQCYIGVTPDGKNKAPNLNMGIMITGASLNFISWPDTTFTSFANVIGGNGAAGIEIRGTASTFNYVGPNCIGTDLSLTVNLGNAGDGISIVDGATDNAIMNFDAPQYIVIRNNGQAGIRVSGGETLRNLLAAGSITNNGGPGIVLEKGGNLLMASPVITFASEHAITATAVPLSLVAFYRDPAEEGGEYLGNAYADASGSATYNGPVLGPYLTAIAIDTTTGGSKNNTSAFSQPYYYQSVIFVTNTNDEGRGSYREAIVSANSNPGPDLVEFAIPQNDPGFNAQLGIWTIKPTTPIPAIMDQRTTIDGSSQKNFIGYDVNPYGPEIELDGSLVANSSGVLLNRADGSVIEGLIIGRFDRTGIMIYHTDTAQVIACYIGTDATGLRSAPNYDGVILSGQTRNVLIQPNQAGEGNLISGNTHFGIQLLDSCSFNQIFGNTIGLDRTRTKKLGNGSVGIGVTMATTSTTIIDNWIGGNSRGIEVANGSNSIVIDANMIGTDTTCQLDFGNADLGILISESSQNFVRDNRIAFNGGHAVVISGPSALCNRVSRNWICHHALPAIVNFDGGNAEHPCPTITAFASGVLSGIAQPNDFIEAYADSVDEGLFFLGYTTAGANGHWSITPPGPLRGPFITATATDANGNTSCFSAPFNHVAVGVPSAEDAVPGKFALEQNYPNPFNPRTVIRYQVAGVSDVRLAVYDVLGREVATLVNERKVPGRYEAGFDASALSSGVYLYQLVAGDFVASRKMLIVR